MEARGFTKLSQQKLPLVIREHQRKYQYIVTRWKVYRLKGKWHETEHAHSCLAIFICFGNKFRYYNIYIFFLDIAPGCIFLKRLSEIRSAVCGCRFQGCWLTKTHSQQLSFVELKVTLSDSRPLSHWKEDSRSLQDKKKFMFITLCCLMIENSTVILLFDLSYSM